MNDTAATGQGQDYDRLSVQEAAARLEVTPDAIRARIRRGTLEAVKEGGVYVVLLPHDTGNDSDTTTTGTDTTHDSSPFALVKQLQSEIARRNEEIADLRGRLDWAQSNIDAKDHQLSEVLADLARQRERTDVLQAQYHQAGERIKQLETGQQHDTRQDEPRSSVRSDEYDHGSGAGQADTTPIGTHHDATGGILGWLRRLIHG